MIVNLADESIAVMQLEKIVTIASAHHQLRFTLMERSLRAVGSSLPIWVIPFDETTFALPANARWWQDEKLLAWTRSQNANRKRKYQCLTTANYQYVDTDVLFLREPQQVLAPHAGFITSCNHWTFAYDARVVTKESQKIMQSRTTLWQKNVFCAGQFACDQALFTVEDIIETAMKPEHISTCVNPPYGDQEGLNLLVFLSAVSVTNLTLPPYAMESTWPGDYPDDPWPFWGDPQKQPYLLHCYCYTDKLHTDRKINWLFRELLTRAEQEQWIQQSAQWTSAQKEWDEERIKFHRDRSRLNRLVTRLQRAGRVLVRGYY